MHPEPERRRQRRSDPDKGLGKLLADGSEVTLVDFSSGGLRIEMTNRLDVGATVQMSGEIAGSAGRIPVAGPCQVR